MGHISSLENMESTQMLGLGLYLLYEEVVMEDQVLGCGRRWPKASRNFRNSTWSWD